MDMILHRTYPVLKGRNMIYVVQVGCAKKETMDSHEAL